MPITCGSEQYWLVAFERLSNLNRGWVCEADASVIILKGKAEKLFS